MSNDPTHRPLKPKPSLGQEVGAKAARKLRAQRHVTRTVWFGLGMMGLIGWSVAIPTLLGAAIGRWLDQQFPGGRSWTLALLVAGLAVGCFNAWYWLTKEDDAMRKEQEDGNDDQ